MTKLCFLSSVALVALVKDSEISCCQRDFFTNRGKKSKNRKKGISQSVKILVFNNYLNISCG